MKVSINNPLSNYPESAAEHLQLQTQISIHRNYITQNTKKQFFATVNSAESTGIKGDIFIDCVAKIQYSSPCAP